ncbi:MAG: hypothetical protein NZO16_05600 [Deltaproteobacteria bacterium]|nr:hypothetical protein [Deltaproteobacteria bacterium]
MAVKPLLKPNVSGEQMLKVQSFLEEELKYWQETNTLRYSHYLDLALSTIVVNALFEHLITISETDGSTEENVVLNQIRNLCESFLRLAARTVNNLAKTLETGFGSQSERDAIGKFLFLNLTTSEDEITQQTIISLRNIIARKSSELTTLVFWYLLVYLMVRETCQYDFEACADTLRPISESYPIAVGLVQQFYSSRRLIMAIKSHKPIDETMFQHKLIEAIENCYSESEYKLGETTKTNANATECELNQSELDLLLLFIEFIRDISLVPLNDGQAKLLIKLAYLSS